MSSLVAAVLQATRSGALVAALVAVAAGCAVAPRTSPVMEGLDAGSRQCAEVLDTIDDAVARAGVAHGMAARVAVTECTARLAAADVAHPGREALLREAAQVPDDYLDWHRVAGLYWLTRIPFALGVRGWQESVREVFARPLEALFRTFAPAFEVDTAGKADLPGELRWHDAEVPRVDSARPVVYRPVSHTRHGGRVLLQLNYAVWFPERPKEEGWDILGGHLDGVIWRVTLTPDGAPWVFDSIHHCGCYHQFSPTARAMLKKGPPTLDETAFAPQILPRLEAGARIALRIAPGTHYLQRVIVETGPAPHAVEYVFAADDELRSLALPQGGRRSVFRPDGVVPGSERGERYWFWPMGVPEPGAMRQWGRHATAFVGRRHFDDPDLFKKYFEITPP